MPFYVVPGYGNVRRRRVRVRSPAISPETTVGSNGGGGN